MLEALPIVCPLRATTGLDCPLCGATRATVALLRGDLVGALDLNALYVIALPLLALAIGWWLLRQRPPGIVASPRARFAALAVVAAFFVARNLPWAPVAVLAS